MSSMDFALCTGKNCPLANTCGRVAPKPLIYKGNRYYLAIPPFKMIGGKARCALFKGIKHIFSHDILHSP